MNRTLKVQGFFLLLALFNAAHALVGFRRLRQALYALARYRIDRTASIHRVRFFTFGQLTIGANTIVNRGCYLDSRRGLTIGSNVVIAHNAKIYTLGHDIHAEDFATRGRPVRIEDFAVIFSNALIMPGVTLGRGAVVLPGAVVARDVAPMTIVGGNPAVVKGVRKRVHQKRNIHHYWFAP
jgi:acetyltransferase-like isoleucine patch superfamily enzyme